MIFDKPLSEIIEARYSVRNYDKKPLSEEIITKLEDYISKVENPFNKKIRIKLLKKENNEESIKLGTYGVIKGANYFLAAACNKEEFAFEALGYTFEKVVLYCTSLGLATVWLGGTFSKGDFAKAMNLQKNEVLPIVSPLGYEGGNKSLIGLLIGNHKNKRKKYSDLFFDNNFDRPYLFENNDKYSKAFEMVRMAPSSINSQPWRILKKGNIIHIYSNEKTDINKIDIGIALCHLDLSLQELGVIGEFKFINPKIKSKYKYIVSYVI